MESKVGRTQKDGYYLAICKLFKRSIQKIYYSKCIMLLFIIFLAAAAQGEQFDDWQEFRGPTGQGYAENTNPPLHWSPTKNIAWKKSIPGQGWSSPIVYKGSVYITTAQIDENKSPTSLRLLRLDVLNGNILWDKEVFSWSGLSRKHTKNGYASPTPIAENDVTVATVPDPVEGLSGTVGDQQVTLNWDEPLDDGGSAIINYKVEYYGGSSAQITETTTDTT